MSKNTMNTQMKKDFIFATILSNIIAMEIYLIIGLSIALVVPFIITYLCAYVSNGGKFSRDDEFV